MKRTIVSALIMALLLSGLLAGCQDVFVKGSGNLITESYNLSDFTKVEAHNGFMLELTRSSVFSVEITVDDNVQEYLEVDKSGDTLRIRLKRNHAYSSATLEVKITMPNLYGLSLSGGSRADIAGFSSSHDLSINLSGGSRVAGDITAGDAGFDLSGGSQVYLEGTVDDLDIDGSGGSNLDLENFPADDAAINLSGGSGATVNVGGTLNINLSGGSRVIYVGEPTLGDTDLSGGSELKRK